MMSDSSEGIGATVLYAGGNDPIPSCSFQPTDPWPGLQRQAGSVGIRANKLNVSRTPILFNMPTTTFTMYTSERYSPGW